MTIWHPRQTWHFFISAVYHTECMPYTSNIAGIYNYWIFGHPILKQLSFLHLYSICFGNPLSDWKQVEKMLCAVLWNSCMQYSNYAPPKVVPLFLDHPIYELLFWLRCHQTVTKYVIWGITHTYLVALCLPSTRCETKKNIIQAKQLFDCDS